MVTTPVYQFPLVVKLNLACIQVHQKNNVIERLLQVIQMLYYIVGGKSICSKYITISVLKQSKCVDTSPLLKS
jgi:hypothetical protein